MLGDKTLHLSGMKVSSFPQFSSNWLESQLSSLITTALFSEPWLLLWTLSFPIEEAYLHGITTSRRRFVFSPRSQMSAYRAREQERERERESWKGFSSLIFSCLPHVLFEISVLTCVVPEFNYNSEWVSEWWRGEIPIKNGSDVYTTWLSDRVRGCGYIWAEPIFSTVVCV